MYIYIFFLKKNFLLSPANYLQVIEYLKDLVKNSGKKPYLFLVGKLNANKLANFSEVDVFVIVACPQNSLIDSKEFFKPVITPFELEIALKRGKTWTGEYRTDFSHLLQEPSSASPLFESDRDDGEDEYDISLLTGKMRQIWKKPSGRQNPNEDSNNNNNNNNNSSSSSSSSTTTTTTTTTIAERSGESQLSMLHDNPAIRYFQQRSYKGLEQKIGETEVAEMQQGRRGIAKGYDHESLQ